VVRFEKGLVKLSSDPGGVLSREVKDGGQLIEEACDRRELPYISLSGERIGARTHIRSVRLTKKQPVPSWAGECHSKHCRKAGLKHIYLGEAKNETHEGCT
jgi:hypothetical protein